MLSSLARPDGRHLANTLARVARAYPHALYYSLRTAYLEFRSPVQQAAMARAPPSPAPCRP